MVQSGDIVTLGAGHYRLQAQLAASSYGVVWRAERDGLGPVALKLVNRAQMERCASRHCAPPGATARRAKSPSSRASPPGMRATSCACSTMAATTACRRWRSNCATATWPRTWRARTRPRRAHRPGAGPGLARPGQRGAGQGAPARLALSRPETGEPAGRCGQQATSLKLADFGTSRSLADAQAHSYAGTASWQAPEQFFPALPGTPAGYLTDARADYFSLGALFYYLVTDGATLRYCSACGDAFRAHGRAGAAQLGGTPPTILAEDEAARFLACAGAGGEARSIPAAALTLLRALLARRAQDRPPHALAISRLIAAALGAAWRRAA